MTDWRHKALEYIPEARALVDASDSPMMLWTELNHLLAVHYRMKIDDHFISRFYAYARWCYFEAKDREVAHAVGYGFYEHVLHERRIRDDIHRWISIAEFNALKSEFLGFAREYQVDAFEREFLKSKRQVKTA